MSGSDKMEVDDGPPPVVVVDQGQDAKTPGSEEKKKWRNKKVRRTQAAQRHLSAPHNSAVSTWPFRGAKSQLLRSRNFCGGGSNGGIPGEVLPEVAAQVGNGRLKKGLQTCCHHMPGH